LKRISLRAEQRWHSVGNPCPVCGGGQDATGEGRCYGFKSSDGLYAYCTNVEGDLPFNDEADAWPHPTSQTTQSVRVNGHRVSAPRTRSARLTLTALARDKALPVRVLRALGCKEVGNGVQVGGKLRQADPKYVWLDGRSPRTDPLFPMPADEVGESIAITAGETDAMTLRNAGRVAFGITSGEKRGRASLSSGHYHDLMKRGARAVTIAGDGDSHGQDWLRQEADCAQSSGLRVSVVDLSPLYDHFGAGVKDLNELWQSLGCEVDAFVAAVDAHTREYGQVLVYSLSDLRGLATKEVPYLVNDLLSSGEKMGLTGPPKNYKTWIALNLLAAVATGGVFLGRVEWTCPEPRPVLMVEEEGDLVKFSKRIERAFRGVEHAPFHLIPKMGFSLLERGQVDWLIDRLHELAVGLLVLDPWQRMIVGADEDKAKETGPAWDEVHRITVECPSCAVAILHHANKAGGLTLNAIRGSSRFAGEVDLSMIVQVQEPGVIHAALEGRDVPNHMAEEGHLEIRYETHDPFAMSALGFRANVRAAGRPRKEQQVLSLFQTNLGVEFSKREVAQALGISDSTAGTHVDALSERGVLAREGRKFRLNEGVSS
jgi:hypothetical protein